MPKHYDIKDDRGYKIGELREKPDYEGKVATGIMYVLLFGGLFLFVAYFRALVRSPKIALPATALAIALFVLWLYWPLDILESKPKGPALAAPALIFTVGQEATTLKGNSIAVCSPPRIYEKPSWSADIIETLKPGASVRVTGEPKEDKNNGNRYWPVSAEDVRGYIFEICLSP